MLGVHTAGSRRLLGGFSAPLGRTSGRSRRNFASAGDEEDVPLESLKRFDRMYYLSLLGLNFSNILTGCSM